jgi:drug/metabolite transporter (DMT)-like permease
MGSKEPLVSEKKDENTPLVNASADDGSGKEWIGTLIAVNGLIAVNVIKVQLTADMFKTFADVAQAYSLYSALCTVLLLVPIFLLKPSEWGRPTREMMPILIAVVTFTTLDMGFQNSALASGTSVALVMCIMATNPFWTVVFETLMYRKCQHWLAYFLVCCLVVGAVLVSLGSPVSDATGSGIIFASIAVLCSASKAVFTHSAFKKYKKIMGPCALLFWVDIIMIPMYIVWIFIYDWAGIDSQNQFATTVNIIRERGAQSFGTFTFVACLGGVRALLGFYVLSYITATSTAVVNIFTQDLNILISIPIQHIPVNAQLAAGVVTSMSASGLYTLVKTWKPCLSNVDSCCCLAPKKGGQAS